jgi:cytochrome c-type biogenesis protein CcmH
MNAFWLVAALFVAGALAWLLPPLWRPREHAADAAPVNLALRRREARELEAEAAQGLVAADRLEEARAELRRRVIEDADAQAPPVQRAPARLTALVLALLLPLASVLIYRQLGTPQAAAPAVAAAPTGADAHRLTPEQIAGRTSALAERLRNQPDDLAGWVMLGRSYTALGRYGDGAAALRRASELAPRDAGLLADLADLSAMAQGKRLAGEPARLVQRALDIDPGHVKALALAGSVAFEAQDYAAAQAHWQRLLDRLPPGSDAARSVQGSLREVRQRQAAAAPVAGVAATVPAAPAGATASGAVGGQVRLSPALASRLQPGDTLFVFARAAEGPRMPLAVLRQAWDGRPLVFRLDDTMAMAPQMKLSLFPRVVVGARVSRQGSATPQPGDLVGSSAVVAPGAQGVDLVIDAVQP